MPSYKEIQKNYVAELRALQPELIEWWKRVAGIEKINDLPNAEAAVRWPTAFSGHPRAIAVFRKYFMQVDDLNYENEENFAEPPPSDDPESLWGTEVTSPKLPFVRPVDLLINDIKDVAPDIYKMVAGIVFVPVGLNQFDEAV
jgi:hypothetical protein